MAHDTTHLDTPSWGQEFQKMALLAGPLALANLLQMLTYAIDVIFIARLGEEPLAASALAVCFQAATSAPLSSPARKCYRYLIMM